MLAYAIPSFTWGGDVRGGQGVLLVHGGSGISSSSVSSAWAVTLPTRSEVGGNTTGSLDGSSLGFETAQEMSEPMEGVHKEGQESRTQPVLSHSTLEGSLKAPILKMISLMRGNTCGFQANGQRLGTSWSMPTHRKPHSAWPVSPKHQVGHPCPFSPDQKLRWMNRRGPCRSHEWSTTCQQPTLHHGHSERLVPADGDHDKASSFFRHWVNQWKPLVLQRQASNQ